MVPIRRYHQVASLVINYAHTRGALTCSAAVSIGRYRTEAGVHGLGERSPFSTPLYNSRTRLLSFATSLMTLYIVIGYMAPFDLLRDLKIGFPEGLFSLHVLLKQLF